MKPTIHNPTFRFVLLVGIVAAFSLCGCTNWKKKHEVLNVEHQNLKGLYEREQTEKGHLAEEVSKGQQTIEQLQKKIAERKQTPAEATGFGKGYDVSFDPSAGTITVTFQNAILFDAGKAALKKSTVTELNHIVSVLRQQYQDKQIDVIGHTDSDSIKKSKWKDNWQLSVERALSVVRYLTQRGISKNKIRAVGCGASRPIASNASGGGKARNRRVEIVVHMRGS